MANIEKLVGSESRLELGQKINDIIDNLGGLPVGTVFSHTCSASFVPENSLPCDGTEYTQAQFPNLYNDWLAGGKLKTCTYTEYSNMLTTYGQCGMWALDTTNKKFKVPTIKDGAVIQQAMSNVELGKAYNAGLPNIKGTIANSNGRAIMWDNKASVTATGAFTASGSGVNSNAGTNATSTGTTISLDASRSNSIYGNSDTVQMNAVALRYFVVVATKAINQSTMDWSAWASSLQGKATVDFSNVSETAKSIATGWVLPDYTAGVNVTSGSYTPPVNGVLIGNRCLGTNSPNESILTIKYGSETIYTNRTGSYPGLTDKCYCPVVGGHTYTVTFNATYNQVKFYPFRGV